MSQNVISLKDALCFIVDNRGKTVPTAETGMKLIATNCISNDNLYPSYINPRYVSDETYRNWFRAHPEPGDIILTNKGSKNGAICLVPDEVDFCIAQDMMALRADPEKIDPLYLFAALRSEQVQADIKNLNVDGVIPHFKKTDFNNLFIPLPERAEQVQIGLMHYALCKKIEVNRKTVATLEEMARALYRSWFVDFDPVHAKAIGRVPVHMDAATAALFPDSFGEDGLPEGWEFTTIGEAGNIAGGATPKTKEPSFWDDGHHLWATPKDLSSLKQPVLFDTDRKITDAGLAKISSGLSPEGTLLLSSRAPIGYLAIAKKPVAVNQGFIAIRETEKVSGLEAYFWCAENMDLIHANANGSTFQEISKKNFRPLEYVLASPEVRQAFNQQAGALFARISTACKENQTLATLRDTLLPRLMSGELRVGEAKEQVEEVA